MLFGTRDKSAWRESGRFRDSSADGIERPIRPEAGRRNSPAWEIRSIPQSHAAQESEYADRGSTDASTKLPRSARQARRSAASRAQRVAREEPKREDP